MTHFSDDLYLGGPSGGPGAFSLPSPGNRVGNPTRQYGVGPLGRTAYWNIVPAALSTSNIAAAQAPTAQVPLTLTAGAGITVGTYAPTGATIYLLDVPRAVSLTSSGSDLSGVNFLITGYDWYGQLMTQLQTGPGAGLTVNTLKAFSSVLSIVPQGTSANTLTVGTSDIFGLPFVVTDAGYIISAKWNNTLAQNAGTLVTAVTTNPATNLTGDTRGTYAQAGAASNGTARLVIAIHLNESQCGSQAQLINVIGVPQA